MTKNLKKTLLQRTNSEHTTVLKCIKAIRQSTQILSSAYFSSTF